MSVCMSGKGERGGDDCPKADFPNDNQWARAFIGWGKGLHAETAQSALTVILKLVISGLTSIILIVLGPEFQENIYFCFIDYAKAFDCVDHNKLWKILKEMGIPDHLTSPLETYMQVRKQQLELDMEQQTGSK